MINIPNNKFEDISGYAPHKFITGFIENEIWNDLKQNWPNENLFKDEGHIKPRKHGQRPHLRKFMCYATSPQSNYFDPYMISLNQLPKIWEQFAGYLINCKEYIEWLKDILEINNFNFRFDWHLTQGGNDVSPHIDSEGKYGSHLIYFMPEGWEDKSGGNTIFYKDKLVESMNPEYTDFKNNVSYSNIGNTSLLFKNVKDGWHGVSKVNSNLYRQIFNVVILK